MIEFADVVVIGGGPAGLSAATASALSGVQTMLIDEGTELGGQLLYRMVNIEIDESREVFAPHLAAAMANAARTAGVDIRSGHRVWGVFPGLKIGVTGPDGAYDLSAKKIVMTNGSIDRSLVFPGGSQPGVFTERAIKILLHRYRVRPGRRFTLVTSSFATREISEDIEAAGGKVVAVIDARARDLMAEGEEGITAIFADGNRWDTDIVVTVAGHDADSSLVRMAECVMGFEEYTTEYLPNVDDRLQTSIEGLFVAGDCLGETSIEIVLAEGAFAGAAAAASLLGVAAESAEEARYRAIAADRIERNRVRAGRFEQIDRVFSHGEST